MRTEKDIEKLLTEHSKLIVNKIKSITKRGEPPGREFEIFLVEPTLPQDFKGFIQRLIILVNDMSATEVLYNPKENSISFWYD